MAGCALLWLGIDVTCILPDHVLELEESHKLLTARQGILVDKGNSNTKFRQIKQLHKKKKKSPVLFHALYVSLTWRELSCNLNEL